MYDGDPEVLRAADPAEFLQFPVSPEANEIVDTLMAEFIQWQFDNGERIRSPDEKSAERMSSTVAALLGDLLVAALNEEAEGYCYRGSDRGAFKANLAESRAYEALKRCWKNLEYMEVVNGFRGSQPWENGEVIHPNSKSSNWVTRLRATAKLLAKLEDQGITPQGAGKHFRRDLDLSVPIVLKADKKGKLKGQQMPLPKNAKVERLQAEVTEINDFLAQCSFNIGPAPYLYRSYNNGDTKGFDWNLGGRFYAPSGSYLYWPSEKRLQMQIEGSPVVEIDITACQLTILHALMEEKLDLSGDPFQIDGLDRSRAKEIFNIIVGLGGAPNQNGNIKLSKSMKGDYEILSEAFPILEGIEEEGWNSLKLQAIDADIMRDTLLTLFREHQTPALPVHDCLIVRKQDAELAERVFGDAFYERLGVRPKFTLDTSD
ncbi:hypothetical protein J7426_06505 [Tropicibacter sp. R16_0]|uniref:hypothetical protein n=1 Tax=Tropicibacter sp. R16_0 TaxID=2821102 RepID=UPI001ADA93BE|nr:hypothetical protein [Tropicibacter sp. R16_0]MBO9449899.1 hypothetical protein [Tropicibacter sp. R16_0]